MTKKYRLKKTAKFNYWTRQFRNARQIWALHNPERKNCYDNSRVKISGVSYKWRCFQCGNLSDYKNVQCDHIIPISNSQPQSKEEFEICFNRLHAPIDKLQILCLICHQEKTNTELQEKRILK